VTRASAVIVTLLIEAGLTSKSGRRSCLAPVEQLVNGVELFPLRDSLILKVFRNRIRLERHALLAAFRVVPIVRWNEVVRDKHICVFWRRWLYVSDFLTLVVEDTRLAVPVVCFRGFSFLPLTAHWPERFFVRVDCGCEAFRSGRGGCCRSVGLLRCIERDVLELALVTVLRILRAQFGVAKITLLGCFLYLGIILWGSCHKKVR
jgi:hypothetical protein